MALLTLWGEVGCRPQEAARLLAQRLGWDLLTPHRLDKLIAEEFGADALRKPRAYRPLLSSVLARLGAQHHLVAAAPDLEQVRAGYSPFLSVHLIAPAAQRAGMLMVERRLDRTAADQLLRQREADEASLRQARFGRSRRAPERFDLVCNVSQLSPEQVAEIVEAAVRATRLAEQVFLTGEAEAQLQFQVRLQLAKFGLAPAEKIALSRHHLATPSEEVFANLLDFYRIAWEYEPRSFPLQWDKDGRVLEAFTPDFYLPEFDLYVELTTMKQTNVTRKNRKVKQLRALYPEINIQVFYQKDFQDLVFKYGLAERLATV